jgi:hypothetical protein
MPSVGLPSFITQLTRLLVAMDENAADFPHMEAERQELRTLIPEVIALSAAQAAQKSQSQQTTRDLSDKTDRTKVLFAQLRNAVKAKYSTRSEKLTEFFLRPLTRRRTSAAVLAARKAEKEKEETPTAPAPATATTPTTNT